MRLAFEAVMEYYLLLILHLFKALSLNLVTKECVMSVIVVACLYALPIVVIGYVLYREVEKIHRVVRKQIQDMHFKESLHSLKSLQSLQGLESSHSSHIFCADCAKESA